MEPVVWMRIIIGLLLFGMICWFAWEGWKAYSLHMYYKRRREMFAVFCEEQEAISKQAEEEARKNDNV